MADESGDQPSEDELIEFAATLLGGRNSNMTEPGLLQETVREAHPLWVLLYRAHHDREAQP